MFTKGFSQMLEATADGNPGAIAHPITWAAGIIGEHPTATDAAFATTQVLLGLAIAWRLASHTQARPGPLRAQNRGSPSRFSGTFLGLSDLPEGLSRDFLPDSMESH